MGKLDIKRLIAGGLIISTLGTTVVSCTKKEDTNEEIVNEENNLNSELDSMVNKVKVSLKDKFIDMDNQTINDATLILLLESIEPENAYGQVGADNFSLYKININSDDMMDEFNELLAELENKALEGKFITLSDTLSGDMAYDSKVLSYIEDIAKNIMTTKDNSVKVNQFNNLYTLFVDEDKLTINGEEFEIRDLDWSIRAVADTYARIGAYYAKDVIKNELYEAMDKRTNNQNSKAYIKTRLEIIRNLMDEHSLIDVESAFNSKYEKANTYLSELNLSSGDIRDLANVLNLNYLTSDKISTKDRKDTLGEYNEDNLKEVLDAAVLIYANNEKSIKENINTRELKSFSELLLDEYKVTAPGHTDSFALDYVMGNLLRMSLTTNNDSTFEDIYNNPYFEAISNYITKRDFDYEYIDKNTGNKLATKVKWQEISDGVNLINDELIRYVLSKYNIKGLDSFVRLNNENETQVFQSVQNTISGECKRAEFVKTLN